ncbi:MAG: GNAT family N-acetyltransferase, partial [Chloroflexota bacterium]
MKTIALRPGEPERDFGQLVTWFSYLEDEPTSEAGLKEEFEQKRERIFQKVAEDKQGELLGFYWAVRNRSDFERADIYLFVRPGQRGQGIGRRLYEDLEQAAREAQVKKLRGNARDTCPEFRVFAERCGFNELRHQFAMELNLDTFDDRPYDEVIAKLQGEGFQFTSMETLGDTEEAQRKLFLLNDVGVVTTLGQDGGHAWDS